MSDPQQQKVTNEDVDSGPTAEEIRLKRLAFFTPEKIQPRTKEWKIEHTPVIQTNQQVHDIDIKHDTNETKGKESVTGTVNENANQENNDNGSFHRQPFLESRDNFQNSSPTINTNDVRNMRFNPSFPEPPQYSSQKPGQNRRNSDHVESGQIPIPLKSKRIPSMGMMSRSSALSSSMGHLSLAESKDSGEMSVFKSRPDLDDLGLSTHRPESELSARSIQGEIYVPSNQGSGKTAKQIFSHKTQEVLHSALGDEKMEELMKKVSHDIGELKQGRNQSENSMLENQSPRRNSFSKDVTSKDYRSMLVQSHDQISLPKSARNSFSSEEIYRQAYGDGMMFERNNNRGFSGSSTSSIPYSYRQSDKVNEHILPQSEGQSSLNSARSSLMDYAGQMSIRQNQHQHQAHSHPFSYPPPPIPPPHPFDQQHQQHSFHHPPPPPHSTTVPISPQSSYSGAGGFPLYMPPAPPYTGHSNPPTHPYHQHQHPFFQDHPPYSHMYGMAQNQGRVAVTAPPQPGVSNNNVYPYSQSYSSAHYGPSRVSTHAGINSTASLEHPVIKSSIYQYSQAGLNQNSDMSLSQNSSGFKIPHPPSNPPALQGKEDPQAIKPKSLEHRRVTVLPPTQPTTTTTTSASAATGEEFKSYNLQRYFSSIELHNSDKDMSSSVTPVPLSSRSVEGDYYKHDNTGSENVDNDDNATSFTNMTGITSATRAAGLTSRLQELGVDLDHLKHLRLMDGGGKHDGGGISAISGNQEISFDAYAKSIRRCPECNTANKAYMDWCVECGEVLIGVDLSLPRGKKKQSGNGSYDNNPKIITQSRSRSRSGTRERGRDLIGNLDDLRLLRRESPESGKGLSLHSSPARNKLEQDEVSEVIEPKDSGRASNGEVKDQFLDVPFKTNDNDDNDINYDDADGNDVERGDEDIDEEQEVYEDEDGVEYVYEDAEETNLFEQISDPILRDFIISYRNRQVGKELTYSGTVNNNHEPFIHQGMSRGGEEIEHHETFGLNSSNFNVRDSYDISELDSYSKGDSANDKGLYNLDEDMKGLSENITIGEENQNLESDKAKKGLEYRNKNKDTNSKSTKSNSTILKSTQSSTETPDLKKKTKKKKKKLKPGCEAIDIEIFGYEESRLSRTSSLGSNIVPALNLATSSDEEEVDEDDDSSEDDDEENEADEEKEEEEEEKEVKNTAASNSKHKTNPVVSHHNSFQKTKERLSSKSQQQGHRQNYQQPRTLLSKSQNSSQGPSPKPSAVAPASSQSKSRPRMTKEDNGRPSSSGSQQQDYQRHWARSSIAWSSYNPRELNTRSSLTTEEKPSSARSSVNRENKGVAQRPSSADYERRKPVYSNARNVTRPSSAKVRSETNTNNINNNNTTSQVVPPPKRNNYLSPSPAQAKREKSPNFNQRNTNKSTSSSQMALSRQQRQQSSPSPSQSQEEPTSTHNHSHSNNNNTESNHRQRLDSESSLHDLCPEFHRLPHAENEEQTADKMHAVARSGYDRFHELTPRIHDGDLSLWQCLPDEVWLFILTFLPQSDLCRLMTVSKGFYRLTNDESLWRYITVRPQFSLTDTALASIMSHHPISLAMVKCPGHFLSTNALEEFFRETKGRLKELNICGCSQGALVGSVVLETASKFCHALTHLDVSFCNINDASFTSIISCCDRLESVCVNGFQSMSDSALLTLVKKHGSSLRTLELYACFSLTANVLRNLGEYCHNLRRLCIGGCNKLTASTMITLSTNLSRVEELDLRGCRNLKNECIRKIVRNCPRIQTLVLANCQQISNPALVEMGTYLKNTLRVVDVCGCNLVGDEGVISLVKNCDRLTSLDISSTGCMHASISAVASSGCTRWIETVKISFLTGISEANVSNLIRHCPRLKLIHAFGCSSLRNLTRLRDLRAGVTIEGDIEVPRMSFQ